MVQPAKMAEVEEIKEMIQDAKSIILNDFTGLNVADISELRRQCRENGICVRSPPPVPCGSDLRLSGVTAG